MVKYGSMSTIKYTQVKPGQWVKVRDGKVVGPASEAEVAAWKRHQADPQSLWQDIVRQARPQPAPAKTPRAPEREAGKRPRQRLPEKGLGIWQDILSQRDRGTAVEQEAPVAEIEPSRDEETITPRASRRSPPIEPSDRKPQPLQGASAASDVAALTRELDVRQDPPEPADEEETVEAAPSATRHQATAPKNQVPPEPTAPLSDSPLSKESKEPEYLWVMVESGQSLTDAVSYWAREYENRFQRPPSTLLCNALDLPQLEAAQLPLEIREGKGIPVHHFWIGSK